MFWNRKGKNENNSKKTTMQMLPRSKYVSLRNKREVNVQYQRAFAMYKILNKISKDVARVPFVLNKQRNSKGDMDIIGRTDGRVKNDYMNIINKPNQLMDKIIHIKISTIWWYTNGAIVWIKDFGRPLNEQPRSLDKIKNLFAINPTWVRRYPDEEYNYYDISFNNENIIKVHQDNIVFYKNPDIHSPYKDFFGDMQAAVDEIAIIEKSSEQIADYFNSGMMPHSIIMSDDITSESQAEQVKQSWINQFLGRMKRNIPFFTSLNIKVEKMQSEFKEMELKDLRIDEKEALERSFDIVLNLDKANRSTAFIVKTSYYENQVIPMLDIFMSIYNNEIIPRIDKKLFLTYVDPTPIDIETLKEILKNHPNFATKERISEVTGLALKEYEDPSEIMISGSMVRVSLDKKEITTAEGKSYKLQNKDYRTITKQDYNADQLYTTLGLVNSDEVYQDVIDEYVNLMQTEGDDELQNLDVSQFFDITNDAAVNYLQVKAAENVVNATDTFKEFIRNGLSLGIAQGIGIASIVSLLKTRNTESYTNYKNDNSLRRIVRTETHNAFMETKLDSWIQSGLEIMKQWLTARDERVRDWHSTLDGETIGIKEMFVSGLGHSTDRPGNFGIGEEDIDCRCSLRSIFPKKDYSNEDYIITKNKELDNMENILAKYEESFGKAYEEAFKKQLDKVINALEVI